MAEPQGGGGMPVTTYEAIVLAMLGYEPMAANYGDDDDWCGLTLDDIDTCLEKRVVEWGDGHSWTSLVTFDLLGFQAWGPFEAWDEKGREMVATMRAFSRSLEAD